MKVKDYFNKLKEIGFDDETELDFVTFSHKHGMGVIFHIESIISEKENGGENTITTEFDDNLVDDILDVDKKYNADAKNNINRNKTLAYKGFLFNYIIKNKISNISLNDFISRLEKDLNDEQPGLLFGLKTKQYSNLLNCFNIR